MSTLECLCGAKFTGYDDLALKAFVFLHRACAETTRPEDAGLSTTQRRWRAQDRARAEWWAQLPAAGVTRND